MVLPNNREDPPVMVSPSSVSSSTAMKLKTLIRKLMAFSFYRFIQAITKAKSIFLEASRHDTIRRRLIRIFYPNNKASSKSQKKIFFGSFRLHYNWCSSHVVPVPVPRAFRDCDSTFTMSSSVKYCGGGAALNVDADEEHQLSELSGYLEWLEEKDGDYNYKGDADDECDDNDDIDRLADMFIASCHEKFLLEKVESYRRFQEMLARGL